MDTLADVLSAAITFGWANRVAREVDEPGGHIALITVSDTELAEFRAALEGDLPPISRDFDWTTIIGNRVVTDDGDGNLTIDDYPTEATATAAYTSSIG